MADYKFFMFDPENGFETYKTAEEAKAAANEAIDYYRGDAGDGWPMMCLRCAGVRLSRRPSKRACALETKRIAVVAT